APPLLRPAAAERPVLALRESPARRAAAPLARPPPRPPRRRPLPVAVGPAARRRVGGGAGAVGVPAGPAPGVLPDGVPAGLRPRAGAVRAARPLRARPRHHQPLRPVVQPAVLQRRLPPRA